MPESLISVNPDPMVQGETAQVCYDFGGNPGSVTLDITWTPPGYPTEVTIVANGSLCQEIDVPEDAELVLIEDRTGKSPDYAGTIEV